jgi:hypothetical protein
LEPVRYLPEASVQRCFHAVPAVPAGLLLLGQVLHSQVFPLLLELGL